MKVAALALALVGFTAAQMSLPIPDGALLALRNAGLPTLSADVQKADKALEEAIEAFRPVNVTCMKQYDQAVTACTTCVEQKCTARAKSVCKPEQWQVILGKTIGFFKDGVPNFFSKTIPDVFVNKIGGGVVDVTKDVGDFFKDKVGGGVIDFGKLIGNGVVDFGKNIGTGVVDFGNGVVDIGKNIGKGVVDVGKTIAGGVIGVGKTIGDGVGKAIDGIKDLGSKIGGAFSSIFGKREALLARYRREEPGCSQFEKDPSAACQFYLQPAYCPNCGFSPEKSCSGYKAAVDKINSANAARSWMTKITDQNYNIVEMKFNPAAIDSTGAFRGITARVQIFGKEVSFTVNQAINPYIPNIAGPIVAQQALNLFKSS